TGDFDRQHTEISDQFARRLEAVAVDHEGGEHRGRDFADARNGVAVVDVGGGVEGGNQEVFQAFLPCPDVAELADLLAHQVLNDGTAERGTGGARVIE